MKLAGSLQLAAGSKKSAAFAKASALREVRDQQTASSRQLAAKLSVIRYSGGDVIRYQLSVIRKTFDP